MSEKPSSDAPDKTRRVDGFTLVIVILVLVLLTTLGLALVFVAETEVAISRNYAFSIKSKYGAEGLLKLVRDSLAYDLIKDVSNTDQYAWKRTCQGVTSSLLLYLAEPS